MVFPFLGLTITRHPQSWQMIDFATSFAPL
jgi:hypothetical protein